MPGLTKPEQRALLGVFTAKVADYATAVAWSGDGRHLAIGDASGEITVFDEQGAVAWRNVSHPGGVLALAWGDGCLASSGQDRSSTRLFAKTGETLAELPGTSDPTARSPWVERIAFSSDASLLATAAGKTVRIWTARGEPVLETEPHPSTVTGLAWNSKGTELATIAYGGAHLFSITKRKQIRHLRWKGSLISVAWSPDGAIIACGSQDCSVHFWRLATGQDSEMTGYPFKPRALAWDARSTMLATSGDAKVTVWRFEGKGPEGSRPIVLEAHRGQVTCLAFAPGKALLASAGHDTGVIVWHPKKSTAPVAFAFGEDRIESVAFRPDGTRLAAIDASGRVFVWRTPDL